MILDFRSPCVILGSSWEKEEKITAETIKEIENVNWIITPHEIEEKQILKTKKLFGNESLLYSEIDLKKPIPKILIIDKIGILRNLYKYSDIALLRRILRKATQHLRGSRKGKLSLFGPNIGKYPEANLMLKEEIAETIHDSKELKNII